MLLDTCGIVPSPLYPTETQFPVPHAVQQAAPGLQVLLLRL